MRKYLALLCMVFASTQSLAVVIDGKDWRQVSDTTGFSWNEVAGICPTNNETCNGSIGGVDFTEWKWASIEDVAEMFIYISNGNFPGGNYRYFEVDSLWADEFLTNFERTQVGSGKGNVVGWTSSTSLDDPDNAYYAFVADVEQNNFPDQLSTNFTQGKDQGFAGYGFWLYQDVAVVPLPAAIWLFGSALVGLGFATQRNKAL